MATRKLIIAALCCGLAILLAGGLWLVATAKDEDTSEPLLAVGDSATIGTNEVTVVDAAIDGEDLMLTVEGPDAPGGWMAFGPTGPLRSGGAVCAPNTSSCLLTFVLDAPDLESLAGYTATFSDDEGSAAWRLG